MGRSFREICDLAKEKHGFSQGQLALRVGMSKQNFSGAINGSRPFPALAAIHLQNLTGINALEIVEAAEENMQTLARIKHKVMTSALTIAVTLAAFCVTTAPQPAQAMEMPMSKSLLCKVVRTELPTESAALSASNSPPAADFSVAACSRSRISTSRVLHSLLTAGATSRKTSA